MLGCMPMLHRIGWSKRVKSMDHDRNPTDAKVTRTIAICTFNESLRGYP